VSNSSQAKRESSANPSKKRSSKEAAVRILIVDAETETSFARPDLNLHARWEVVRADSMQELEQALTRANPAFDLVVAYQDRPKQLSQSTVMRCLAAKPLTRLVQVLGPWCDGDLRTPGRLVGLFSISFREAAWRLAEMVEQFRIGKGSFVRPLTAPELVIDFDSLQRKQSDRQPLRVGIRLPGRLAIGAEASLTALGHIPVIEDADRGQDVDVVLIDGDKPAFESPRIPILPLHGFSRSDSNGALAKSHSLAELDAALRAVTASATIQKLPISQSHTNQ
jgi:hypothetical protein